MASVLIPIGSRLLGEWRQLMWFTPIRGSAGSQNTPISDDAAIAIQKAGIKEVMRSPLVVKQRLCLPALLWLSLGMRRWLIWEKRLGSLLPKVLGAWNSADYADFHTGGVFTGEVARQVRAS